MIECGYIILLKGAPKKRKQKESDNKTEETFPEKDEEVPQCNYCQYRHVDPKKPVQRLYPVSKFPDQSQDYVVNYSSVSEFPEREGLLKDDDKVCNACRLVLQSKYDAFCRGSVPFTPKKRGRKSLTEFEPQPSTSMTTELSLLAEETDAKVAPSAR